MIYLPDKAPSPENIDYNIDMTSYVPEDYTIDDVEVVITGAGNSESPVTLTVHDWSAQPLNVGDTVNRAILFWLSGGTPGVRYRGTIELSDNESTGPTDRRYIREFEVMVRDI